MKKFFCYEFRRLFPAILIATGIISAISVFSVLTDQRQTISFGFFSVVMIIMSIFVPLFQNIYKMHRRSADVFYSLPLTRKSLYIVKNLCGALIVVIPFTIAYWLSVIVFSTGEAAQSVHYIYAFLMYLTTILFGLTAYAINSFIFTRANNANDGAVFVMLWSFVLMSGFGVLTLAFLDSGTNIAELLNASYWNIYSPIFQFSSIWVRAFVGLENDFPLMLWLSSAFFFLCGVGSVAGSILLSKKEKGDEIGQTSNTWWGYRTLIPIYMFLLTAMSGAVPILIFCYAVLGFISTVFYRRGLKFKISDILSLVVAIILGIIVALIIV